MTLLFGLFVLTFGFICLCQSRPARDARLLSDAFIVKVDRCRLAVEVGTLPDMAAYASIQPEFDEIPNRNSPHFATHRGVLSMSAKLRQAAKAISAIWRHNPPARRDIVSA